jgi:hypothetical protein
MTPKGEMMREDEKNARISDSIEPIVSLPMPYDTKYRWTPLMCWHSDGTPLTWQPRSWHTDETASAILLERMPEVGLSHNAQRGGWFCDPDQDDSKMISHFNADRKTCIRDAYLAMIESRGQ